MGEGLIVGTDRLGRPLTNEEKRDTGKLLRAHDFAGACTVALLFARKLARTKQGADDLLGRAQLRLFRWGWDPNEVPLAKRMCRLVWSEWTNEANEKEKERAGEEGFLREMQETDQTVTQSAEAETVRLDEDREAKDDAKVSVERMRAAFLEAADAVNVAWLDFTLEGVIDLQEMARRSGRDVTEFYGAAKRRKRLVKRWLAEKTGSRDEEDE
jgi:hypothetical protein